MENQINYCQFCSRPLPPKKSVAYFREQQQQRKNHCIKNAPIKLSPGYNCASSEYFMAPPTSLLPLLLLSFIVYGCAGEPHGKRFCAFSCLVYTPRAHEYAMVSAPATPPPAHLVACSTIAKLKSKNIRCEVCIKLGTQKSLQLLVARGEGERRGITTIL